MVTPQKLTKTSVQLPADMLKTLDAWPGLTRSEAIRLSVERALYLWSRGSDEIAGIADYYSPILGPALAGMDYDDYILAARALPEIVGGYLSENRDASLRSTYGDAKDLDPAELIEKLRKLNAFERIGVMDYVIAHRHLAPELDREARRTTGEKRGRKKSR